MLENWEPFAPNGWSGIQSGAAVMFFAFIGFDAVSTTAEECRNPRRDLPIGILGSLAICTVIYVIVGIVVTGAVRWDSLNTAEPLATVLKTLNLPNAAGIVSFGSLVAHTAVLLVFQLGQPRILCVMARDGLLPRALAKTHGRFKTPYVATILTGLFVGVGSAVASLDEMADLCNIGTLSAFLIACLGVLVLRRRDPDRPAGLPHAVGPDGSDPRGRGLPVLDVRAPLDRVAAVRHLAGDRPDVLRTLRLLAEPAECGQRAFSPR